MYFPHEKTPFTSGPLGALRPSLRFNPASPPNENTIPRWKDNEDETFTVGLYDRGTRENLGIIEVDVSGETCMNYDTGKAGAVIVSAMAIRGWGPLLYDFAALVTSEVYRMPLVSDRFSVSWQALRVWSSYAKDRPDVAKVDITEHGWACWPSDKRLPLFGIKIKKKDFTARWKVDSKKWLSNELWRKHFGR